MLSQEATAKLEKSVHIPPRITTLKDTLETLSQQMGLSVTAAPYLEARQLVLDFKEVTGRQALDALAELND